MKNLICKCGEIIPNENIEFWHSDTIEEGYHFGVIAKCNSCKFELDIKDSGTVENLDEAIDKLQDKYSAWQIIRKCIMRG